MSAQQLRALALIVLLASAAFFTWLSNPHKQIVVSSFAVCANQGYPVSDTSPETCSDGAHTFVGPTPSPAPSMAPVTALTYQILVDGDSKGSYPKAQQVISSGTQWVHYWDAVHASLPTLPPILPVDFATSDVVAINEGLEPTDGYSLAVTSVSAGATGTSVDVISTVPVASCTVTHQPSNEYLLVQTPKLTSPISFQVTTQARRCSI